MKLSDLLRPAAAAPDPKLRQEIFALGGRHRGDPLAGALRELEADDLTPERRTLLRAVVSQLRAGGPVAPPAVEAAPEAGPWRFSLGSAFYIALIVMAATWSTIMLQTLGR